MLEFVTYDRRSETVVEILNELKTTSVGLERGSPSEIDAHAKEKAMDSHLSQCFPQTCGRVENKMQCGLTALALLTCERPTLMSRP